MLKATIFTGALVAAAASSSAGAQSWSVGVGVGYGDPGYYGPPPAYLYDAPPPVLYAPPPVVYAPPPVVRSAVSPDAVFDGLERAGYREFSPMAFRDGVYKLNAVNRRGDLVALEVSVLSGRVEREFVLQRGRPARVTSPAPRAAPVPGAAAEPSGASGDPLVVY